MVLRVPILYGEVEFVKESAVTILLEAVKNDTQESRQDDYARRFPTHVGDVAYVISQLLTKKIQVRLQIYMGLHAISIYSKS